MNDWTDAHGPELLNLMDRATGVILDFDGPMCRLFPVGTAPEAEEIKRALRMDRGHVPPAMTELRDSHAILQELRQDASPSAAAVADLVTRAERAAVLDREPTDRCAEVITLLAALGKRLAIASNNDAGAITEFLALHKMAPFFTDRVFGRDSRALDRMKPEPDSVLRAVTALGLSPSLCVMVGDKVSDLEAARAAGTSFLGCTHDETERDHMLKLGADAVVTSLSVVLVPLQAATFSAPGASTPSRTMPANSS